LRASWAVVCGRWFEYSGIARKLGSSNTPGYSRPLRPNPSVSLTPDPRPQTPKNMSRLALKLVVLFSLVTAGCEYKPLPSSPQKTFPVAQTDPSDFGETNPRRNNVSPLPARSSADLPYSPLPDEQNIGNSRSLADGVDPQIGEGADGVASDTRGAPPRDTQIRVITYNEPLAPIRSFHDWDLRETAIDSLSRIGRAAVPKLVEALRHPSPHHRVQAAKMLARIGPEANQAVDNLVAALGDENEEVRKAAARALGQIGPQAAQAVNALMNVIEETTPPE